MTQLKVSVDAYFDGACPDNPCGEMGWGYHYEIFPSMTVGSDCGRVDPHENNSNNTAEHMALKELMAHLNYLIDEKGYLIGEVNIYGDSNMVIKQMKGEYKVRREVFNKKTKKYRINRYFFEADAALKERDKLKQKVDLNFEWIRREENQSADDLSKAAMNYYKNRI